VAEPYHRFVFNDGKLVGDFESLYEAEAVEEFDSWHQDDLRRRSEIVNLLRSREFASVIDVGCGKGALLSQARADRVVGIDISPTALETARERLPHAEFRCRDALAAFDPGERFELVMVVAVLYYVPEWQRLLELAASAGDWLLVWAYVPHDTAGTIASIAALREEVAKHGLVHDEIGEGETWGALVKSRREPLEESG
jgi:trans-aconitate methyltransferase